jgi:hypothetical protein
VRGQVRRGGRGGSVITVRGQGRRGGRIAAGEVDEAVISGQIRPSALSTTINQQPVGKVFVFALFIAMFIIFF